MKKSNGNPEAPFKRKGLSIVQYSIDKAHGVLEEGSLYFSLVACGLLTIHNLQA